MTLNAAETGHHGERTAFAFVPLLHEGQVIASLNLASRHHEEIPVRIRPVIEAIAAQAGGVLARIRAEEARRESEATLRALFDSPWSYRGIVELVEDDILILSVNHRASALSERTPEQMRLRRATELGVPRDSVRVWIDHCEKSCRDGAPVSFEFCDHWHGQPRWTLVTVCFLGLRDGGRPRFAFVGMDLTHHKQAEVALQQLPGRILEAQEAERQRVARELHDGVNQLLVSTKFRLHTVEEKASRLPAEVRDTVARCRELLAQALEECRRIAYNLRPPDLDDLGLSAALHNFCNAFRSRTRIDVEFDCGTVVGRLPPAVEPHLFRIVQEALANVEKHARASRVRISLLARRRGVELEVEDNGCGFDPDEVRIPTNESPSGLGLPNMRERATILGGTCEIKSRRGQGTTILVCVPLEKKP